MRFNDCLAFTLKQEGGFVDNPADPGGATNFGITLATLRDYTRWASASVEDLKRLDNPTISSIYLNLYWRPMNCDYYPPGVDLMVFDFGVNAGPGRSVKILQDVAGTDVDGNPGLRTIAAVKVCPVLGAVLHLADAQLAYYKGLPGFAEFGAGWTNRTLCRKQTACAAIGT